ncbi:MAG: HAD family hydrolase [Anaerolineales bacterium]|nr:HAD family hydrolase [Anaerolineales bacterium]
MPIPEKLILDLDDTILDYSAPAEALWPRLFRTYAERMGIPAARLQEAVDASRRWYWSDADRFREGRLDLKRARRFFIRRGFEQLGRTDFATADELADVFTREREIVVRPFGGAVEALERIRRAGSRTALLTNGESSIQRAKIERFRLAEYFDAILIEGERGIGKPDPRAFQAALEALDARPEGTWMIGDDPEYDIRPAKDLGMRAARIGKPPPAAGNGPDPSFPSLQALVDHWES